MKRTFESQITARHPMLDNHRVLGLPVLPGLAYIDLLYQLASPATGLAPDALSLKNLSIFHPLAVPEGHAMRLRITLDDAPHGWDVRVEGAETDAAGARLGERRYVTAELHREPARHEARIEPLALRRDATRRIDLADIYAAAVRRGLVHAGIVKAEGSIHAGPAGCLVELDVSRCGAAPGLTFHPALIDGAAMATEAMRSADDPDLYLPLHYAHFSCAGALGERCLAWIPADAVRGVNDIHTLDILFCDADGREFGALRGMTSKKVRATADFAAAAEAPAAPSVTPPSDATDVERRLLDILAAHIGRPAASLDAAASFFAIGLQSAQMLSLLKDVEAATSLDLSPTLLFEYGTPREVAQHLQARLADAPRAPAIAPVAAGEVAQDYPFDAAMPLLQDHLVLGRPALIGVAHPCLALETARRTRGLPLGLRDVVFTGGPVTPAPGERVDVRATVSGAAFHTARLRADGADACSHGTVEAAGDAPARLDVDALAAGATPLSPDEVEAFYTRIRGFRIGPALRAVERAWRSGDRLLARLSLAGRRLAAPDGASYALDPLLLNACYYFLPDDAAGDGERLFVPLAIERLSVFRPAGDVVWLDKTVRVSRPGFLAFDAALYDAQGECIATVENASMKEVPDPALLANARFDAADARAVAVVGVAGRYPRADDVAAFWRRLAAGEDCIGEIPAARWDWRDYPGVRSRWGGFLDGVDEFAPLFFGISPREAAAMDPQERLFLEQAWVAIEDAGHTRESIGRRTGVYVGVMSQEYPLFAAEARARGETVGLPSGVASIANRVSYCFDFHGPSVALDTMCSSSLSAVALACDALRDGRIDAALAGGVNVSLHPNKYLMLGQGGFLAGDGRCQSFGRGGDGYVPGEGVGVVVLKRLADAARDGDDVRAVIRGVAVNHGGRTGGYTVPSPRAQRDVVSAAWRDAGVDVRTINCIEAHGTGTVLGDPIEVEGLVRAFGDAAVARQSCALGSVKSNIGHAESAAGIAGLTKLLLQLRHGRIAPSLHADTLNPNIDFVHSPFFVPQELREWPRPVVDGHERPRAAGLSSFGAGGANAHLVLEEYTTPAPIGEATRQLVPVSARSADELAALARRLADALESGDYTDADLPRIAWTLQAGREAMTQRAAVTAATLAELVRGLRGVQAGAPAGGPADARQWLAGESVDWSKLHPAGTPRRIGGLPGYPFARERCWIGERRAMAPPAAPRDDAVMAFEETWQPAPRVPAASPSGGAYLAFVTDPAHREAMRAALGEADPAARLVFVARAASYDETLRAIMESPPAEGYVLDAGDAAGWADTLAQIDRETGGIRAVFYAWALEAGTPADDGATRLLLQSLAAAHVAPAAVLLAGAWQAGDVVARCRHEAAIGVDRSMRLVLPRTAVAHVLEELPAGADVGYAAWARRLRQELDVERVESTLHLDGRRHACRVAPLALPAAASPAIRQGGTYLVTGGLGSLGAHFAAHLLRAGAAHVIVAGRSAPQGVRAERLDALRRLGRVDAVAADVTDAAALAAALAPFGTIDGVIHAAGVAGERAFADSTMDDAYAVRAPKIDGTLALDAALRQQPLDFVCYCASSSAALGDFGGGDYAAGNRFQMAYARERARLGLPGRAVAIGWPLWADGGMHLGEGGEELYFATSGQRALATDEALAWFDRALAGTAQPLLLAGDAWRIGLSIAALNGAAPAAAPAVATPSAPTAAASRQSLEAVLKESAGAVLHLAPERFARDAALADFGFDSITLQEFAADLERRLGHAVAPTLFYSHPTIARLAEHLAAREAAPRSAAVPAAAPMSADAVAIVGMSGRFPGAADVDAMWRLLAEGRDAVGEIAASRFDWRAWYSDASPTPDDRTNCRWSGNVDGADEFDPLFFEIAPRDAVLMDPRQRLLLQESYRALEDAACGDRQLRERTVAMYVGVEQGGYGGAAAEAQTITANHDAVLAARLSYHLDLTGPNMAINTACSSGLVALHQACLALRAGECDTAVAAAANLLLTPASYVGMTRAGMLSPDGRCFAFDRRANGMVPGEAVVAVVVRRLADALADGDPVHAVIRASGVNYDGRTNGITAPSSAAQSRLIESTYRRAGIDARDIAHVVAHGTATALGDPIEVDALAQVFGAAGADAQRCALTSTKPNFGHTFAASGLVSLVGLVQGLRHETIPPSLHCDEESTFIDWRAAPLFVNKASRPWPRRPGHARLGAVSAFGMSGTNAHVVVQGHDEAAAAVATAPAHLLAFSARTDAALMRKLADFLAFLAEAPSTDLLAASLTLLDGRQHFRHRCALVVRDAEDALRQLAEPAALPRRETPREFVPPDDLREQAARHVREAVAARDDAVAWRDALAALADLWLGGAEPDWPALFGARAPRRLRLPGYPFARERYWIAGAQAAVAAAPVEETAAADVDTGPEDRDALVVRLVAERLGLDPAQIDEAVPLDEYGLDSIHATALVARLRREIPGLAESVFLEHPTLGALRRHLAGAHPAQAVAARPAVAKRDAAASDAAAVVGIAGLFPGADDLDEFWRALTSGGARTEPLPARRRALLGLAETPLPAGEAFHAGYLDRVEYFDHELFKLSRDDARTMDPQLRKLLETTWRAIADAGYALPEFRQARTAVYVATRGHSGYCDIAATGEREGMDAESPALYANRLSNSLDLKGPSEVVDTGCSSFLVALRHALAALREGRCEQAVVATAHLSLSPRDYTHPSTLALYSRGRCTSSFGRGSDGYLRSEVVGAVIVKRLDAALRDGDAPYCTLRGVGVCHGGKSPLKWYSPNPEGQKLAIAEALAQAAVPPASVDYVEAEANGSQLGDASEIIALQSAYGVAGRNGPLAVSSLKPVFGHAESGSTFPALAKVMLALREERIPGVHGLGELNEGIRPSPDLAILAADRAWPRTVGPRRAAVHSLSLGGVNAHLIVEEAPSRPSAPPAGEQAFVFSARTLDLLRATVANYISAIRGADGNGAYGDIASVAFTLQFGRTAEKQRLAIVAGSLRDLRDRLEAWHRGTATGEDVFTTEQGGQVAASAAPEGAADPRTLARAWAAGGKVDWRALHAPDFRPRRAHLPAGALKAVPCWRDGVAVQDTRDADGLDSLALVPHWVLRPAVATKTSGDPPRVVLCGWNPASAAALAAVIGSRADIVDASASPGMAEQFSAQARGLFSIVRDLIADAAVREPRVQVAVPNGLDNVCLHALAGLLRTARREHSRFRGQLVVFDHAAPPAEIAAQLAESIGADDDALVQYVRGERRVQAWREFSPAGPDAMPALADREPVVLVTGGAGALALAMARRFLADPAARVVLAGRSEPSAALRCTLAELGDRVRYERADVSDRDAAHALVASVLRSRGRLTGIVHCAGTLRDAYIVRKNVDEIDDVLAPKVAGLCHLDEASRDVALEFIVAFSSVSAVFGNAGQADYALANAFMDSFAAWRNQLARFGRRHGRTLSINWPLWRDGGMRVAAEHEALLRDEHGMHPLPPALGADLALRLLASRESQVAVTYGNVEKIRRNVAQWRSP